MMKLIVFSRKHSYASLRPFEVEFRIFNKIDDGSPLDDGSPPFQSSEVRVSVTAEQYRLLVPGRELSIESLNGLESLKNLGGIPGDPL